MNPNQPVAASVALAGSIDWSKLDLQSLIEAINQGKVGGPLTTWLKEKSWEATVEGGIQKRTLNPWKTIQVGGIVPKELIKRIAKEYSLGDWAKDLMGEPAFTVAEKKQPTDLVILTPRDLGFTEMPRTDEFMTKEFCAEWSAKHLAGYAIELCSSEDGPQLRLQYDDQPNGEVLWMAMERITDSDGRPSVFDVERDDDGRRWLHGLCAYPGDRWDLDYRIVFRLRKFTQS